MLLAKGSVNIKRNPHKQKNPEPKPAGGLQAYGPPAQRLYKREMPQPNYEPDDNILQRTGNFSMMLATY